MPPIKRSVRLGAIGGAIVLAVLAWYRHSAPTASPISEPVPSADAPPVAGKGSLMDQSGTLVRANGAAKALTGAPPAAKTARSPSDEALLQKLNDAVRLDPKLEAALQGAGRGAKDLAAYLKWKRAKNVLSADDLRALDGTIRDSLVQNAEEVVPALGRVLTGLEGDPEMREGRADLLGIVASFPTTENPEISRSALSNLGEIYGADSPVKAEDRFDLAVSSMQAYLVTTGAGAPAATAALARAMGGKIDPAVKDPLRSMISDRYPGH